MDLYEYQGKELFRRVGIPVSDGRLAVSPEEARAAAAERHYLDTLALAPERLTGIATTRHGHGVPTRRIRVVEAGHPVPDEAGFGMTILPL